MNHESTLRIAANMRSPGLHWRGDSEIQIGVRDWGSESIAESVTEEIASFLRSREADVDITTPFERLSCYSDLQNDLRQAVFLANEKIYVDLNSQIITAGCEMVSLARRGNEVGYALVGDFVIFGKTRNDEIHLLVAQEGSHTSFLPENLLGVDDRTHVVLGNLSTQDFHQIIVGCGDVSLALADRKIFQAQDLRQIVKKLAEQGSRQKGLLLSTIDLSE
jgi:hypothetical protein